MCRITNRFNISNRPRIRITHRHRRSPRLVKPIRRIINIIGTTFGPPRSPAIFLPSVILPAFEDGHPSNSDPLDEQDVVVRILNALQNLNEWDSTAVIIAYDDSDGWYDHVMPPIVSRSATTADALNSAGICGASVAVHRDFALGEGKLRGSRDHRSRLCGAIYRGQLRARPYWRSVF
jgi:hypothetical protein